MYADKNSIATTIGEFDTLLWATIEIGGHQSRKLTNSVVHMYHIITHLQLVDFFECDDGFASSGVLRTECDAVVAFEYLMVGVAANLGSVVHKTCVQGLVDRYECDTRFFVFKDGS